MASKESLGIVTSAKMPMTRRVEIQRLVRFPKYGKFVRRKTICHVHDGQDESHVGDIVAIVPSRPRSKTKRWALARVVSKSQQVDFAAMRLQAGRGEAT